MDLGLKNKVVIVTGGTKGIGEGISRSFLDEGATVVIVNRSLPPEDEGVYAEGKAKGQDVHFIQADLCEASACQRVIAETLQSHKRIDVIISPSGGRSRT